jgi:ribonuclease PH
LRLSAVVTRADTQLERTTRTGGWVALSIAIARLARKEKLTADPVRLAVSAVSAGLVNGEPRLDLAYEEDSKADVDFNFVITDGGKFVELQKTAEAEPFSAEQYAALVALAQKGARELITLQREAVARAKP